MGWKHEKNVGLTGRILDRYVAKEFLISFLIALVVVLSLRVLFDLFAMLDEFVEEKEGVKPGILTVLSYIAGYYGPKLVEYFRDFAGVMILLAAAFSLVRMRRQNELTAILASGVSLKRVVAPIVFLGVILNLVMVVDQEVIIPRLSDRLARFHDEMAQLRKVRPGLLPDEDGALLHAHSFEPEERKLVNMLVVYREEGRMVGILRAPQARWDPRRQGWRLRDGWRYLLETKPEEPESALVEEVSFYKSSLTPEYIWLQRNSANKSLMSSAELSDLLQRDIRPLDRADALSQKYFRVADPIINVILLMLGLPLLATRERQWNPKTMGLVVAGSAGCFVVTFVCKLLAGTGLEPFWAVALPILIFAPVAVIALDSIKT